VVIATVDLEKVFAAYPATKRAKDEINRLILIKENEIAAKRAEIFALDEEVAKLQAAARQAPPPPALPPAVSTETAAPLMSVTSETLPGMSSAPQIQGMSASSAAAVSTEAASGAAAPAPADPETVVLSRKEKELSDRKQDLRAMERSVEKNLLALEEAKTKTILAKIFSALQELSQEKSVDMIVDKNAILWGSPKLDLTDSLLQKLKTRIIEDE
jgi:Skp family chaperone for outer membrane proteins